MENERLAQWVAASMKADGITAEKLAGMSAKDRETLSLAYVDAIGKKIVNMQSQLLTRPDSRPKFAAVVRSIL